MLGMGILLSALFSFFVLVFCEFDRRRIKNNQLSSLISFEKIVRQCSN